MDFTLESMPSISQKNVKTQGLKYLTIYILVLYHNKKHFKISYY